MVTWEEDRLGKLRELVNLDALPLPPPDVGVVADWRAKLDPSSFEWKMPGWELFFRHVRTEPGGAIGEWGFKQGREQLAVKIFVSSRGVQPARDYFRRLAMSSTAPEYPYKPPPGDPSPVSEEVVTFFVSSPSLDQQTHNDSVLRLFRNVVFDVRAYDARIDETKVLEIADDLLEFAQQKEHSEAPLRLNRPKVRRTEPPEAVLPDGVVQVRIPAAPDELDDFQGTDFEVRVRTRGKVDFLGFDKENANFRWKQQPGDGRIRVQVIDRRTLLSRTLRIPGKKQPAV